MKRIFVVLVVLILGFSVIGCNRNAQRAGGERTDFVSPRAAYAGYDLSVPMSVSVYFFTSTEAPDLPEIIEKANNEYFRPILNTTMELMLLPAANRSTQYPLILAGGDDVDIIFTAPWHSYDEEAAKGSFVEITPEFREKWMPTVNKTQSAVSWEQSRTQGIVYGIPTSRAGWDYKFAIIREDLKEKYNLPSINNWQTLEQFIFTVSRNEPTVPGYNTAATTWELMNVYMESRNVLLTTQPVYFAWENKGVDPTPEELHFMYTSPWYFDYARTMRRWMEEGAWSRNVMNNTVAVRDAFVQGRSASMFWNGTLFSIGATLEENGQGRAGWYDVSPNALVRRMSFNNNLWAIAANSDRPERAGLVLDLMKTEPELVWLLKLGIDGRHYIGQPNNTYVDGPERARYPANFWTWALDFPQDKSMAVSPSTPAQQIAIQADLDRRVTDINMDGFRVNLSAFQSEWAVISALIAEYNPSFLCGVFGAQTDAKLQEFSDKLRAAGIDRVIQNVRTQYADYIRRMR